MAIINNQKELLFYISADRIMNGFPARKSLKERLFGRSGGVK